MTKWTALYIKLLDGTMKRIGNIQPSTGAMSLYYECTRYHDSPDLYFVDEQGNYEQYSK